ncbi:hypothetical protein NW758_014972 [Fusarium oxysporum]|nr:hypothetical protein NW758_014972 [Fusarium oxysporum]
MDVAAGMGIAALGGSHLGRDSVPLVERARLRIPGHRGGFSAGNQSAEFGHATHLL